MHTEYKSPYQRRLAIAASERGRRMARRRWDIERHRRAALGALTADRYPSRIVRRIVVIDNETDVREATFWNWESARHQKRKLKEILQPPLKR
jgi:hypothetical protein